MVVPSLFWLGDLSIEDKQKPGIRRNSHITNGPGESQFTSNRKRIERDKCDIPITD